MFTVRKKIPEILLPVWVSYSRMHASKVYRNTNPVSCVMKAIHSNLIVTQSDVH